MFDTIIKYLPVIGVMVALALIALWLRNRNKYRALEARMLQPRASGPQVSSPPTAQVVKPVHGVPTHVLEFAETTGARIAVQTERAYDEVDRLMALEKRRGELDGLRQRLGLPGDSRTNNALLGNWDEVRRDRGPQTQFLDVVQAGLDKLKADKEQAKAASADTAAVMRTPASPK